MQLLAAEPSPVGSNTAGKMKPGRSPAPCAATMSVAGKRTRSSRVDRGSISGTVLEVLEVKSLEKSGAEASFKAVTAVSGLNVSTDPCCYSGLQPGSEM